MPVYSMRVKVGNTKESRYIRANGSTAAKQIAENIYGKGNVEAVQHMNPGTVPKNAHVLEV